MKKGLIFCNFSSHSDAKNAALAFFVNVWYDIVRNYIRGQIMLENIHSPKDIKNLTYEELSSLAEEIRSVIIDTVSSGGGHLASNLGIVETTLALHRVFSTPEDKIIFDVSHQSYAHKLITGRYDRFETLRKYGGISGFTDRNESEYDTVTVGHSGSSVSTALGIAEANKASGNKNYTVAVVGDGSFTNGMIYEAINTCADSKKLNLLIILNDNEMSIAKNVGGMTQYLSRVRTSRSYLNLKHSVENTLMKIPFVGLGLARFLKWWKDVFKSIFIKDTLFENLGIPYIGPVDGHDTEKLEAVLEDTKQRGGCALVHIITKKGKGYENAENTPEFYHSTGKFNPFVGAPASSAVSFTSVFGEVMCREAEKDDKIFAITAAMRDGVGLGKYSELFPDRYRDVGIAEEHAVAFAGGLALGGMNPVCALYSTFAQRTFDQLFHDVALQNAHITLALDHCGLVGGDGYTHQGIYDTSIFPVIPNVTVYSPETYLELEAALSESLHGSGIGIVRYPKGTEIEYDRSIFVGNEIRYTLSDAEADAVIITYGIITSEAVKAAAMLSGKYRVRVVKLTKIHPLDFDTIAKLTKNARCVCVLSEDAVEGGVGEKLAAALERRVTTLGIKDEFIPHGGRTDLLKRLGLDAESVAAHISSELE